jgi:hypothetical protein
MTAAEMMLDVRPGEVSCVAKWTLRRKEFCLRLAAARALKLLRDTLTINDELSCILENELGSFFGIHSEPRVYNFLISQVDSPGGNF